jgi:hypothetical protein
MSSFPEIAICIFVVWLLVGVFSTLLCFIIERLQNDGGHKYIINDPGDFLISVAFWPLMLCAASGLIKPPAEKSLPKKKIKIIISEDDETEEAFASRCKKL